MNKVTIENIRGARLVQCLGINILAWSWKKKIINYSLNIYFLDMGLN